MLGTSISRAGWWWGGGRLHASSGAAACAVCTPAHPHSHSSHTCTYAHISVKTADRPRSTTMQLVLCCSAGFERVPMVVADAPSTERTHCLRVCVCMCVLSTLVRAISAWHAARKPVSASACSARLHAADACARLRPLALISASSRRAACERRGHTLPTGGQQPDSTADKACVPIQCMGHGARRMGHQGEAWGTRTGTGHGARGTRAQA
mmetsp:Transcript_37736/g.111690  ORF Transcript_37736/g.111690 Transcript_37736/m.111690 type:complete len:209 (+) Transcript_37736:265-891(+)